MHVKVVNSYAAASLFVPVKDVSNVDFPTLGKPTNPMRVSPDFVTGHIVKQRGIKLVSYCIHLLVIDEYTHVPSNPRPASFDPADLPPGPLISSDFNLLILAFNVPN